MSDRDRLAADLHSLDCECDEEWGWHYADADRLLALGWTRLDEERLARALNVAPTIPEPKWRTVRDHAAAIAKAYREDTDATD